MHRKTFECGLKKCILPYEFYLYGLGQKEKSMRISILKLS